MKKRLSEYRRWIVIVAALLFLVPLSCLAEGNSGGITLIGDRQGVCVKIDGECVSETISFKLSIRDANQVANRMSSSLPSGRIISISLCSMSPIYHGSQPVILRRVF